jgi:hypothetical protein
MSFLPKIEILFFKIDESNSKSNRLANQHFQPSQNSQNLPTNMHVTMMIPNFDASRREQRLIREGRTFEALESVSDYISHVVSRQTPAVGNVQSCKFILSSRGTIAVLLVFDELRIPTDILGKMMMDRDYYYKLQDKFSSRSKTIKHKMYLADEEEKARAKTIWEFMDATPKQSVDKTAMVVKPAEQGISVLPTAGTKGNNYSVCIPLVYPSYTERDMTSEDALKQIAERVKDTLTHHGFGTISRIDVKDVIRGKRITDSKGVEAFRVFIHFSDMNQKYIDALERENGSARVYYDGKWFWDVRKNAKPPGPSAYHHPLKLGPNSFPGHPNPNASSVELVCAPQKPSIPGGLVVTLGGDSDSEYEDDDFDPHTPTGPVPSHLLTDSERRTIGEHQANMAEKM